MTDKVKIADLESRSERVIQRWNELAILIANSSNMALVKNSSKELTIVARTFRTLKQEINRLGDRDAKFI